MSFFCSYCDEGFEEYDELEKHIDSCDRKPLPTSKEVDIDGEIIKLPYVTYDQDPEDVDKSVLYSTSDVTITHLVQTMGYPITSHSVEPGAYRKVGGICPHCEEDTDSETWLKPPCLLEVCSAFDRFTVDTFTNEMFILVSECPNCGIKSVKHSLYQELFWLPWINHRKIIDWLVERGAVIERK